MFTAFLAISASAYAATPVPAAGTGAQPMHHHEGMDMCKEHAQACKDDAAKFDKWCAANADKCTAVKAMAEKHIEYCAAHEKDCAEHMHKMHEHMKDWCAKNPGDEHCKMMKDNKDSGGTPPAA